MITAKEIYWNKLHLSIPAAWETTVKTPRHLIFEHDLCPLLEIRWEQPGKRGSRKQIEAILKQFAQPFDAQRDKRPELPDTVSARYDITALNEHGMPSLLLVCRECGTTILIGLHRESYGWLADRTPVLESMRCCRTDDATEHWQILDFFFAVPSGFGLESCSFQFGISDLRFTHKHADLQICRLAPASEHLKQRRFEELFASFCSAPLESMQVVDARTLRYHSSAGTVVRMWNRMRRKRPFKQASFSHFPGHDRILGFMIGADHRLPADWGAQLENGYGIVQEAEETDYHP